MELFVNISGEKKITQQ